MGSFNLETAIATWRQFHAYRRVFLNDDLDELERHLRDFVAHQQAQGRDDEAAFRLAVDNMGDLEGGRAEYEKVYWGKHRRQHTLTDELYWRLAMFKNYLTVALRNLKRNPGYSLINIVGLAVGVACCLLLSLYVRDELSFDRYHEHADDIYRVNLYEETFGGELGLTPTIVAPLFLREFPEVEAATRLDAHGGVVRVGEQVFDNNAFYFADSTFFEVFTHPLLHGDPETALNRPNTVVLTETTARKYFGEENPVGQTIVRNNDQEFEVTGVMADVPLHSHYHFDFLASFASRTYWASTETWGSANFFTYVRLGKGASATALTQKIDALVARLEAAGDEPRNLVLQPLTDIHLRTDVAYDLDPTGDATSVYGFATVALLILLIACINYMNLATARSAQRAKEVGLRKALGAYKAQLVGQFYSESVLLTLAALVLAVGLFALGLPWFNALSGKALTFSALLHPTLMLLLVALFVVVSLATGSYPAFYLSRFEPVRVLRGRIHAGRGTAWLRQGLVVLQFGISAVLIIGAFVVMNQLRFISDQHLGFDMEHLVVLPLNDPILGEQYPAMVEMFKQSPSVIAAAAVNQIPGELGWTSGFQAEGMSKEEELYVKGMPVDAGIVDGLGLSVLAGSAFPEHPPAPDSGAYQYILNEAMLNRLGWEAEDAIGRRVAVDVNSGEVVGVVNNFHFRSLHETIEPLAIWYEPRWANHLIVRLAPGNTRAAMTHLETVWGQFAAHRPFTYRFLDDVYNRLYRSEQQLGQVLSAFVVLALLVACLGLFGLASFTAEKRTREIGVRKVLGASIPSIIALLSKDFVKLVGIAFLVGLPVAYFLMQRWLDDYAYRIELGASVFVLAGVLALGIALMTVSYQALKAALADPVKSLRYE